MGFLAAIGTAIADTLIPIVTDTLEKHAAVLIPRVADTIQSEIEKRMPMLVEACVVAITKTMGELAVNGVDRLTDMMPGTLDDQIVDPLARNILDEIKKRFGI